MGLYVTDIPPSPNELTVPYKGSLTPIEFVKLYTRYS